MDFTDFLFPNNMQKYRFPVYFNYRDMICTFINLNESMGTMLFSLSYDSSVPEDKRDVYSALDCVQRDDIFDYLIALHYERAIIEKRAFIDMKEDNLARIYVSLTTVPAFSYIREYAEASQFNLISKEAIIYSKESPFDMTVKIDDITYNRHYIVRTVVMRSTQYEPFAKMVLPFFVHLSVTDVTEPTDTDVERNYRVRNHVGLFNYLAQTELGDAFTAIQEFVSPSSTWQFSFKKFFAVQGQRRSLNCYIMTRIVGTKSFYVDDMSFYEMSLRVPVNTPSPSSLNVAMMQSVGTYALSSRGSITVPHITYVSLSDHSGYRDANASFVPEHVVLDPSLPNPLDMIPKEMSGEELIVETIPIAYVPFKVYMYFPVTPSYFPSDIICYIKIAAASGDSMEDIIWEFTNDDYALTMLSEDNAWVYFALRDKTFKERFVQYVCPSWDYNSMSAERTPKIGKRSTIEIHDRLEDILSNSADAFEDASIVDAWNDSHYRNEMIRKIGAQRLKILEEAVPPEEPPVIPTSNSDNKVNDTSFLSRLKKKLFG